MAEMLKIDNIHKTFHPGTINEKHALNGVCLSLDEGDFVTVIGGNGAGKSTTLNAVAGLWPIDSGKIFIGGDDVTRLSEHKRARYPCFPGSDDRHRHHHVHRGKYGNRRTARRVPGTLLGNHKKGARRIPQNARHA